MKILLANGSPKVKDSASRIFLDYMKGYLTEQSRQQPEAVPATKESNPPQLIRGTEILEAEFHAADIPEGIMEELKGADALIFACPLYVDGLPGHLLSCLIQLGSLLCSPQWQNPGLRVYGIVNCGFYEGIQAQYALDLLQNWCAQTGIIWCGGIGIGGGGGISSMPAVEGGHGPRAPVEKALSEMAATVLQQKSRENKYVSVAFPRLLYQLAAQMGWRQMIRANGGRARDLGKRPAE